jgi:hypothetical protein
MVGYLISGLAVEFEFAAAVAAVAAAVAAAVDVEVVVAVDLIPNSGGTAMPFLGYHRLKGINSARSAPLAAVR